MFLPLVLALSYSLTDKNLLSPHTGYVGLANYRELLSDDVFKQSVKVTAIMTALIVVLPNALGLGIALMLACSQSFGPSSSCRSCLPASW